MKSHESLPQNRDAGNLTHRGLTDHAIPQRLKNLQLHFSQIAPQLTTHLTDREGNYILSTHPEPSSPSLTYLSNAFVGAYESASRMSLGVPFRITLTTTESNFVVIQSAPSWQKRSLSPSRDIGNISNDVVIQSSAYTGNEAATEEEVDLSSGGSKMLVGTVVAPARELADGRVAIWAVEDVARGLQSGLGNWIED